MYELCAPVLYGKCTPYDFKLFVAGLRTNEHIDRTSRLHIRQKRLLLEIEIDCEEVSYAEIFESGWTRVIRDLPAIMQECHSLIGEGIRIRQFITEGLTVLPNLRSVSMGGIGDDLFCTTGGYQVQSMYSCDFENGGKVLSHALIDLPTIHHYCQTVAYGPLALPHKILKVRSPLKTFTHHLRGTQIFSSCLDAQEKRSPPIILGSMNRYYCQAAFHAPYPFTDECKVEIAVLLKPIIAMLDRSVYIADPTTGVPIKYHGDSNVLDGTQIEIYDYIRAIESSKIDRSTKACINPADDIHTLPPQSLSFPQRILDQILPEQWKGKVVLKNREQAPPCPACGLNLQEEFKDVFKFYKSMRASSEGQAPAYVMVW